MLSQQGSTGCTNSFANWEQQTNQIQAKHLHTQTSPFQEGLVSNAVNNCGGLSGVSYVLYSTPGKAETQQHSSSSGLFSTGGQSRAEKPEGGRLDAGGKLRQCNSEPREATSETRTSKSAQRTRRNVVQIATKGQGLIIWTDSEVTKNDQIKSVGGLGWKSI